MSLSITSIDDLPAWFNRTEYPFIPKTFKLKMGSKMSYIDEGKGDPIIMVHGNPIWSFAFRNIIKANALTNRCIAPDHIGFGLSDKPLDWDYLPKSHSHNLIELLEELDLKNATLIVNDWGGPIGLSYALKYPERIKHLIILNTWMWPVDEDPHFKRFSGFMGGILGSFLIRQFNFFAKVVVKQAFGDKSILKPIHPYYFAHLPTPESRKGSQIFPKEIINSGKWLAELWNQREKINKIPTTFIWGMKDIAFREKELNFWLEHWNNSKVIRLPEVGHYPQEEAPNQIIKELQNINKTS